MSEAPSAAGASRAATGFVFVTLVLDVLALGIVAPVLPKLVEDFVGGDTVAATGVMGWFGTSWALMQFVFSPILGALSDRFGRRPVLLLSMAGLGLDYVLMAMAPSLAWLFVGRVLSGMTAASFSTANAYISDVTPPEKRAGAFGLMGAAFGLGFVLGPALGGLLGGHDPRLPFWVAAVFAGLNTLYGLFVLPESLPPERRSAFSWRRANPVGSLMLLRSSPQLFGLASVHLLNMMANNVYPAVFVLSASYRFGWGERAVGLTLGAVGLAAMVVQGALVGPLVRALGERRALLTGLAFATAGYFLYGFAPSPGWVFAAVPVAALGGLYGPASQALMTRRVDKAHQGQLQGSLSGLLGIGALLSPTTYTQAFGRSIDGSLPWHLPGAPFYVASAFTGLAFLVALRASRPSPGDPAGPAEPAANTVLDHP